MASSFCCSGIVFCLLFFYGYSKPFSCDDNIQVCLMKLLMEESKVPVKLKVESGWEMMKVSPNSENTVNIVWRNWTILDSLGDEYCLNNCMKKNDTREEAEDPPEKEDRLSYCIKECSTKNYTVNVTSKKPENFDGEIDPNELTTFQNLKGERETEFEGSLPHVEEPPDKTVCISSNELSKQLARFYDEYYPQDTVGPYLCCNSDRHLKRVLDFFKFYRVYEHKSATSSGPDAFCFIDDVVPLMKMYQGVRRVRLGTELKCPNCDDEAYLLEFVTWYKNKKKEGEDAEEEGEVPHYRRFFWGKNRNDK